jgi:dTDP-4-amino-4,6-dideoxygalactose transaminase
VVATLTPTARLLPRSTHAGPAPRWVPCLPTLWPSMLLPRVRAGAPQPPFPFAAPRARAFYFARNAVFHGVRLLGLSGAEVLVPAYHHGVEVEALEAAGAQLRFVRVDGRMRLDLEDLEAKVGARTRAIYVIHYAGFPQPMQEILGVARRHGLRVVEDCALALLSRDGDVPLGASGDLGVFCLYKTVPVPNGGILAVNADLPLPLEPTPAPLASTASHVVGGLLANAAVRLGSPGVALRGALRAANRVVRRGTGATPVSTGTRHFDPAAAGLGMSSLSRVVLRSLDYEAIVAARRRNYFVLLGRLRDLAPPVFSELPAGVCPLFYPLTVNDKPGLRARLAARGVETVDFWSTHHPSCPEGAFPEVDLLRRRVLELPVHQDLAPDDVAFVARAVEDCL